MAGSGPELGDLLSMGLTLALCVVVGFGLGGLGDLATGTFPLIAMVGLALGVVLVLGIRCSEEVVRLGGRWVIHHRQATALWKRTR